MHRFHCQRRMCVALKVSMLFTSGYFVITCPSLKDSLHCTALHCTLHCTGLHCTALHCTAMPCTALQCIHCIALHCAALCCPAHCTASHCTALHRCTAPEQRVSRNTPLTSNIKMSSRASVRLAALSLRLHCCRARHDCRCSRTREQECSPNPPAKEDFDASETILNNPLWADHSWPRRHRRMHSACPLY
jgi:hypothetical protein